MAPHRRLALAFTLMAFLATVPVPGAGQPAAPPAPEVIDIQGAPALGPDNAPVTIVEFGDYQCLYCARGAKALRKLHTIYPDRVRWVFKHSPIQRIHPAAALAHEAAIAAQEQGKFWEMHELIFSDVTNIGYNALIGHAEQIGLDMAAFKDALDTRRLRPRVIRDLDESRRLRVVGTPTYFVNGVRYVGARSTPEFRAIVDAILRQAGGAASGPPPAHSGRAAPGPAPGGSATSTPPLAPSGGAASGPAPAPSESTGSR
jgi:protein-disulfide isomerase